MKNKMPLSLRLKTRFIDFILPIMQNLRIGRSLTYKLMQWQHYQQRASYADIIEGQIKEDHVVGSFELHNDFKITINICFRLFKMKIWLELILLKAGTLCAM